MIGEYDFETLPDYLEPGLRMVSIGLNPSLNSVRDGYYFATRQNRFWRALNASGLIDETLCPGKEAMERLFHVYGIGATDVVKRPSNTGAKLRAVDYREWAPLLRQRLLAIQPCIAWFHGKQAYANYLRYAEGGGKMGIEWGAQPLRIGGSRIFITPNPSPANAVFTLEDISDWYRRLKAYGNKYCG